MIRVGSDFSGVGAFDQALMRLGIDYETVFACDMDKYARQTYIDNYGSPNYFPENVYSRSIPKEPLDFYMTSPPCQAFSLAGKRLAKEDERGILFFNSHEFIEMNRPRFFLFENVKGLLSANSGFVFNEWINMLGGKSVNGAYVLDPHPDSVPYHIYWKVLNARDYNVPQNRERVFIVGIRDDEDNDFQWPDKVPLERKLKSLLDTEIEQKYMLTEKMAEKITFQEKSNGEVANLNKGGQKGPVYSIDSDYMSCLTATDYKQPKQIINSPLTKTYTHDRLNQTLQKNKLEENTTRMIDAYNKAVHEHSCCINSRVGASNHTFVWNENLIRKITPRECFRLMDFPDTFRWTVSDTQAYKQAGNSIVVGVLAAIINQLKIKKIFW